MKKKSITLNDLVCLKKKLDKLPQSFWYFSWAVTGTFHGAIIEAESEGAARRAFHKTFNGESITHVRKRNCPAWWF